MPPGIPLVQRVRGPGYVPEDRRSTTQVSVMVTGQFFAYLSDLLGRRVIASDGNVVGKFYDFAMNLNNDIYPRAKGIIVCRGLFVRAYAEIPMTEFAGFRDNVIHIKCASAAVSFQKDKINCEFGLRRDILDQQIVDVENRKVVRVNDVHLLKVDSQFHVAHVDVGLRALVTRLDIGPFVDAIVRAVRPKAEYLTAEELISWKNAQVLTLGNQKNVLKLDVVRAKFAKIPPVALADMMRDLDIFEQASLFRTLPFDVQLKVFTDMIPDDKANMVGQLEDRELVQIISNIPSDEAADFLMSIPKDRVQQLMRLMETKASKRLRTLLGFRKNSAGGLMATEYLSLNSAATVEDAINKVKASVDHPGSLTTIYIVDEAGKYLGTTTIRRFINEPLDRLILTTCHPQKVFVHTDDGMEKIALLIEQYKYSAIPVLDDAGVLVGSITVDDVMEALISLAWGKYKDQL
ncbi:MAG: magnesium transporter [Candidatus Omnitrophica bacterium]|nr:magnesium transporter [Candidatus Omnitrophota bacterium]